VKMADGREEGDGDIPVPSMNDWSGMFPCLLLRERNILGFPITPQVFDDVNHEFL